MEVVTMEKKAFDLMMARYDALVKKVELLKHKANGKRLNKPTKKRTTWNRNQNRPQPNSRHRPLRV
jgi:hypothetical protein